MLVVLISLNKVVRFTCIWMEHWECDFQRLKEVTRVHVSSELSSGLGRTRVGV